MSNRSRQFCARLSLLLFLTAWLPLSLSMVCEGRFERMQNVVMVDCVESDTPPPVPNSPSMPEDCGLKLCLAAKVFGNIDWKATPKLEALLVWLGGWLLVLGIVRSDSGPKFHPSSPLIDPPPPLIHLYCRLLE